MRYVGRLAVDMDIHGDPWRSPWMDNDVLVISMDIVDIHFKVVI